MTQKSFSIGIKIVIILIFVGLIGLSIYFYTYLFSFEPQTFINADVPLEDIDLESYEQLVN